MPETQDVVPSAEDITTALKIARELIEAGVPVFSAAPDPERPGEYYLPKHWQLTVPSLVNLDRWQPGHALAAVGGIRTWKDSLAGADILDEDPRNGGDHSVTELRATGHMPRYFGVQETPSGGRHYLISPTGERKATGFMPGLDLQSGDADGQGRGFVWIAPTVRPSKAVETMGRLRPYRWTERPDLDTLAEHRGTDDSHDGLIARVYARRSPSASSASAGTPDPFLTASQLGTHHQRRFTFDQAREFCRPALIALQQAPIGQIEERCNTAAVQLAHFVPQFWSTDQALGVLRTQLEMTAYDEHHPASRWTVEKFRAVLDGTRPVNGGSDAAWTAERVPDEVTATTATQPPPAPQPDAVDALLAEMLTAEQVAERPAPQPLIKGLLNLDSESWIIGEPGSKKSFVALDMAAHVARGMNWQNLRTARGRAVMIIAEGAGGASKRVRAWEKRHGPIGPDLLILPRPVQSINAGAWSVLVEVCRRLAPTLVVLDTQARVTVGLEENSAKEMGIYVEAVRAIRQATGACVLTVHHTGRNGGDARGSSALDGAQDTELKVIRKTAFTGELRTEKQKDLEERDPLTLTFERIDIGLDEDGDQLTSLVLTSDPYVSAGMVQPDEPEEWERGHGPAIVQLFKVLRDQGGSIGLTQAQTRSIMIDRFYGKDAKKFNRSTFHTAWTRAREKFSASGDPVMVNVSDAKWIVDTEALGELEPGRFHGNQNDR